jgi:hypothetical protein
VFAGPVTLTATGSSDPMSGFDHYESTVNGGSGVVQGASVVVSGHGTFTVKLRAVDGRQRHHLGDDCLTQLTAGAR